MSWLLPFIAHFLHYSISATHSGAGMDFQMRSIRHQNTNGLTQSAVPLRGSRRGYIGSLAKTKYALSDRVDAFETGSYGCGSKPGASKRAGAVRARRVRRGMVVHSIGRSPATRTPFGIVFGCAGIGRSRGRSIGTVRRQRAGSLLTVARRPCGDYRPLRAVRTPFGRACSHSRVVRQAWAPVFGCFLGDLRPLGGELEYRFVKDSDRCFLSASRSNGLTTKG